MSSTPLCLALAAALSLAPTTAAQGTPAADAPSPEVARHAAIERAALDYAESYYEVRRDYAERSLSRALSKLGFETAERTSRMDYEGFLAVVAWFEERGKPLPGPKRVEILDALDCTALVKLTGSWGVDYLQLTQGEPGHDDAWVTRHVVWEAAPLPGLPRLDDDARAALRAEDTRAVEDAVRAYLLAFYEAEPERLDGHVSEELVKYGFWRDSSSGAVRPLPMDFAALVDLATRWNANASMPADAPREIAVLDLGERIACARLHAAWGVDYMNLVKRDGRWEVVQVLWQTAPEAAEADAG